VNVQPPDWLRIFPNAATPLTSALTGVFTVPRDEPERLKALLKRIERRTPAG
jgi:hypothetical protein